MNLHSHPSGNSVLLLLAESGRLSATWASKTGGAWSIRPAVASTAPFPEALSELCRAIELPAGCRHVVLVSHRCLPLLQDTAIPPGLTETQTREMLRWDSESALASSARPPEDASTSVWEIGFRPAGPRRIAIAAVSEKWLQEIKHHLHARGLQLAAVVPATALTWGLLSSADPQAVRATAIIQSLDNRFALSIFEQGKLEFFSLYETGLDDAGWPRTLLADARSFALQRVIASGEPALLSTFAPVPGLPAVEVTSFIPRDEVFWQTALAACTGDSSALQPIPVVPCMERPPELWQRPAAWWAASASVVLLASGLVLSREISRSSQSRIEHARVRSEISEIGNQLAIYSQSAVHHDQLQAELQRLEHDISSVRRDQSRPGGAPCARVSYLSDSLNALANTFAQGIVLERYRSDFEGNIALGGNARNDAAAQDALGRFYGLMKKHPIHPARLTTSRDAASQRRVQFMAESAGSMGRAQPDPVTETAPVSVAAASPEETPSS